MTSTTFESEVENLIQNVFQNPQLQVKRTMAFFEIPGWSSLLHIRFIVALEEKFKVSLPVEDVILIKNIGELSDLVQSKIKIGNIA